MVFSYHKNSSIAVLIIAYLHPIHLENKKRIHQFIFLHETPYFFYGKWAGIHKNSAILCAKNAIFGHFRIIITYFAIVPML